MSRRARGEGTVYFDQAKGKWVACITEVDASDRRRRPKRFRNTQREALSALRQMQEQSFSGQLVDPSAIRVSQLAENWLSMKKTAVEESTYDSYDRQWRLRIEPLLGGHVVQWVTPAHIGQVLASIDASGSTKRHTYVVMHQMFDMAVKWKIIGVNPVDSVSKPRPGHTEMSYLSKDAAIRFIEAAREDRLYALYVLALLTGMRQGELYGLKWSDIDLERGTVRVQRKVVEVGGKFVVGPPKTERGRRTVTLPQLAIEALKGHARTESEWVFHDSKGGACSGVRTCSAALSSPS